MYRKQVTYSALSGTIAFFLMNIYNPYFDFGHEAPSIAAFVTALVTFCIMVVLKFKNPDEADRIENAII